MNIPEKALDYLRKSKLMLHRNTRSTYYSVRLKTTKAIYAVAIRLRMVSSDLVHPEDRHDCSQSNTNDDIVMVWFEESNVVA